MTLSLVHIEVYQEFTDVILKQHDADNIALSKLL